MRQWVDRAEAGAGAGAGAGDDGLVARSGKPVARITQRLPPKPVLRLGVLKGRIRLGTDFDAPLPAAVLASFERPERS